MTNNSPSAVPSSTVVFLGDCRADGTFGRAMSKIPKLFPDADCFVINLECAVAGPEAPQEAKSHPLVASYEEFEAVVEVFAGREVVFNLANNHAADAGPTATARFKEWCAGRGIRMVGGRESCVVSLACGVRLGIAAGITSSSTGEIATISQWDQSTLKALKSRVDALVFLAHWGEEYVFFPSPSQVRQARDLWEMGVGLVVGCHPHVVQGRETQASKAVYYSIGNGTMYLPEMLEGSRIGAALECAFDSEGGRAEEIRPFAIAPDGGLSLLGEEHAVTFREVFNELANFPTGGGWWHRQAAKVFFRNHMRSWMTRIRNYGAIEVLRMCRQFLRKTYLLMAVGRLAGIGKKQRNDAIGGELDHLVESLPHPP